MIQSNPRKQLWKHLNIILEGPIVGEPGTFRPPELVQEVKA